MTRTAPSDSTADPSPAASPTLHYSPRALERARRALVCSPFRLGLFAQMRIESVAIGAVSDNRGIHSGYTRRPLAEVTAEDELMWLIQVGLLRREVDGQGLTDSFRLTPLGRQLVEVLLQNRFPDSRPTPSDQLYNALNRWWRLPGWFQ